MKPHYSTFRDCHKGEEMVVLGNGPSLEKVPLEFMGRFLTFGCNRITMLYPRFCPTYYLGLGANHVNSAERRATIEPIFADDRLMAAFMNRLFYQEFDHGEYTHKLYSILGPRYYGAEGEQIRQFSLNPLRYVGLGYSNVYPMLQIAYYMGIQTVYLVGLDHDYPDTPHKHFYDDGEGDARHFETAPGPYTNDAWRFGVDRVFAHALEAYKADGRRIVNLTPETKCEVFEHADLHSV